MLLHRCYCGRLNRIIALFLFVAPVFQYGKLAFLFVDFLRMTTRIVDVVARPHQFAAHELMKGVNGYDRRILGSGLRTRRSFDK